LNLEATPYSLCTDNAGSGEQGIRVLDAASLFAYLRARSSNISKGEPKNENL